MSKNKTTKENEIWDLLTRFFRNEQMSDEEFEKALMYIRRANRNLDIVSVIVLVLFLSVGITAGLLVLFM